MADVVQIGGLSPERIGKLNAWAQVALAARCAWRVLPAYVPGDADPPTRTAAIGAAYAGCLVALHAAASGADA
jgi:hypothetical protein